MKSIDDFPFQFDADQLFEIGGGLALQDTKNVASDPANASVLADMKAKLMQVLAPSINPLVSSARRIRPHRNPCRANNNARWRSSPSNLPGIKTDPNYFLRNAFSISKATLPARYLYPSGE